MVRANPDTIADLTGRDVIEACILLDEFSGRQIMPGIRELGARQARVQENGVDRVDKVFVHLQPAARVVAGIGNQFVVGQIIGVEHGEFGFFIGRPHVGKHKAFVLPSRIGAMAKALPQFRIRRLTWCLEDGSVGTEQPAVITATDSMFGDNAVFQ